MISPGSLKRYIEREKLGVNEVLDRLQLSGVISDNVVGLENVAWADEERAVVWLEGQEVLPL
jgi:hypothetical protein